MTKPTSHTVKAWIMLLKAHRTALTSVENALKKAKLPPLIWYDILLELERSGDKGLRPFQLEKELLLPQYGISRILERMEKAGYLSREMCENDGRGQRLVSTEAGLKKRAEMWTVYGPAIEETVGTKLSPDQSKATAELLNLLLK
ncbi:MAG: MarR family transcriptional regulator [Sneathiella sp.]|nr:MarR family transcriptional regulator [Sneathiella sp.]